MKCLNCDKEFHWCPSCSMMDNDDEARADGYCCEKCAKEKEQDWEPFSETDN